jgi:pilus assembly protein TadC
MKDRPEAFLRKTFKYSLIGGVFVAFLLFLFFDTLSSLVWILFIALPSASLLFFFFFAQVPVMKIKKREKEINQEVIFSGRYILVKIDSGVPLYNSLIDASRSYGISAKYFKEIVDDIRVGVPIEEALAHARDMSPSKYYKLILTELITSLKTGVDISISLREVLKQITKEQIIEIKKYSKKLNAFMMMYMVLAIVFPSLGVTLFMVGAGFIGATIPPQFTFIVLLIISLLQFTFISMLRSMRPMVNI